MSGIIAAAVIGAGATYYSASKQAKRGQKSLEYGQQITDKALAGLDTLDADYQKRLDEGLPADMRQTYAAERGYITDEQARSNRAFGANLVQRAKATGGQVTEQAALDASVENNAATEDAAFQARNQIAADEAHASLENTNKLLDAIEQVRIAKLGGGFNQQNIGSTLYRSGVSSEIGSVNDYASMLFQLAMQKNKNKTTSTPSSPYGHP